VLHAGAAIDARTADVGDLRELAAFGMNLHSYGVKCGLQLAKKNNTNRKNKKSSI
jgi:hypothetical protein